MYVSEGMCVVGHTENPLQVAGWAILSTTMNL